MDVVTTPARIEIAVDVVADCRTVEARRAIVLAVVAAYACACACAASNARVEIVLAVVLCALAVLAKRAPCPG